MARRKKSNAEATAARTQALSANDAIAIGTLAGATTLAVAEAAAERRAADDAAALTSDRAPDTPVEAAAQAAETPATPEQAAHGASLLATQDEAGKAAAPSNGTDASASAAPVAAVAPDAPAGTSAPDAPQAASAPAAHVEAGEQGAASSERGPVADADRVGSGSALAQEAGGTQPLDVENLASRIADQVSSAIDKVASGLSDGLDAETIGKAIAADITDTVSGIVAGIAPATAGGQDLADSLTAAVDTLTEPARSLLDDTDTLTDGVEDQVASTLSSVALPIGETATGPAAILEQANEIIQLPEIPSSILGSETDEGPGGLLASLFYDDGKAEQISPAASSFNHVAEGASGAQANGIGSELLGIGGLGGEVGAAVVELAGLSYSEVSGGSYDGTHTSTNVFAGL